MNEDEPNAEDIALAWRARARELTRLLEKEKAKKQKVWDNAQEDRAELFAQVEAWRDECAEVVQQCIDTEATEDLSVPTFLAMKSKAQAKRDAYDNVLHLLRGKG